MTEYRSSRVSTIIRSAVALTLLAAAVGCAGSAAKVDTRSGGGAGNATVFAGTWDGTFDASDFSGTMGMILSMEEGSYSGTLTAGAMGEEFSSEIENFKSEGKEFTFYTFMADGDLYFKGTVEGNTITCSFQVFVGGDLQDEGTCRFTKK